MQVAILGYGRFGRALAELLEEAGVPYRGWDPGPEVAPPEGRRAEGVADLVGGADLVVLAVPVAALEEALDAVRPSLGAGHTVLDVCSVKVGPSRALEEALGSDVPWAATHPLFGPSSLATGRRPLDVVVCPNELHPEAVERAAGFWERLGCRVLRHDAEAHDRVMAESHALTYFVAKGMMDAGLAVDVPFAPPSFQALARTLDTVRSDAGHLFAALHLQNPFAAEARRRLLEALRGIEAALEEGEDVGAGDAPGLAIPDLGQRAPELREAREVIDDLDRELMSLLARRVQVARRAGRVKRALGRGVRDPAREAELLASRRAWAAELGLPPGDLDAVFDAVLRLSRRSQREDPHAEDPSQ